MVNISDKIDLKVGFQAAVRNATCTTHAGHVTQLKQVALLLQRGHAMLRVCQ